MDSVLLGLVVCAALMFAWTNGFHDAANVVATPLATGALTARIGLALAAVLNVLGGLLGVSLADALQRDVVAVTAGTEGLVQLCMVLAAAMGWNLLTWWWGMPSSSSHAVIGALVGTGWLVGLAPDWRAVGLRVLLPGVFSPLLGLFAAGVLVVVLTRLTAGSPNAVVRRRFRALQTLSASALAICHGLQDAQRTAVLVAVALTVTGHLGEQDPIPAWVRLAAALALGLGTAAGGWRLINTVGRRITTVGPVGGFAAESVAALALGAAAGPYPLPVSSSHLLIGAVVGAGAAESGRATVRWPVVLRIGVVAVVTPVAAGLLAAGLLAMAR